MNAGLFPAIRASGLFATDPDLGLGKQIPFTLSPLQLTKTPDIDNPAALTRFYELLLCMLRIVAAVVLSRGSQNKQTISQVQLFLKENRPLMVGVFKRQARVLRIENGRAEGGMEEVVDELVDVYVLVVSLAGFLEVSHMLFPVSIDLAVTGLTISALIDCQET